MNHSVAQTSEQITIGIDIAKEHLDVYVHPDGTTKQFSNDRKGHAKLIAWMVPMRPTRIIFEATGAYHRGLEMALGKVGLPGVKINPLQARRFAEATGKRVKTDQVDAAMLARFGATLLPEIPAAKSEIIDKLAELLAARRALVKDRTATANRSHVVTLPLLKRQCQQRQAQIERQIDAIDHECATILAGDEALKTRLDILLSIPCLAFTSALAVLVDMPELGTLDAKQAASLAGLAPVTRQSGSWLGKSYIQGGRALLRQAIYMPALVAIRFNPPLKAKYDQLRATGKPAKVAVVAIMRKLIVLANALIRDNRKWTPNAA